MPTLPTQADANTQTTANIAAFVAAANSEFIAEATVLINNSTNLGYFQIAPFVTKYLNVPTVTAYFQNLGYIVKPPIINSGYPYWNHPDPRNIARIFIFWTTAMGFLFLLEDGDFFELESGSGEIALE